MEGSNNGWFIKFIEEFEDVEEDAIVELEAAIVVLWVRIDSSSDTIKKFLILWISQQQQDYHRESKKKKDQWRTQEREWERERKFIWTSREPARCEW